MTGKFIAIIFMLLSALLSGKLSNEGDLKGSIFCVLITGVLLGYVLFNVENENKANN